jgi:BirA family biotin operon repressor/biotin-[acetyl-CoA-carboxylase] ligase
VTSTLDIIHQLAGEDAPAGTVVLADQQMAGRGRLGREWYSPSKAGIWMGYLMRPAGGLESGVLALRVGIAIARALDDMGVTVQLKWPNDILLDGCKLGGVLCEARWLGARLRWIAVGIGLNVVGQLPRDIAPMAISLSAALPNVTRVNVLEMLLPKIRSMSDWPVLTEDERRAYAERDWLKGRHVRQPAVGEARGIDQDGALLVRANGRLLRVVGGSVVTP